MSAPVSVVIPCYCSADTISRAVSSVFAQSLPPSEVILIDDASPDNTLEILYELQEEYGKQRLKIIALTENRGPGHARNMGWQAATQDYIACLDADDVWHPDKLSLQFRCMQSHPEISLCGHPRTYQATWSEQLQFYAPEQATCKSLKRYQLLTKCFLPTSSLLFKAKDFLPFPLQYHCEDYGFLVTNFWSGKRYAYMELPLAFCFKAKYGERGLSSALWKMEKEIQKIYYRSWQQKYLRWWEYFILSPFSLLKYLRRLLITQWKQLQLSS